MNEEAKEVHYHFQPVVRAFRCYTFVGEEKIPFPPTAVLASTSAYRTKIGTWITTFSCSLEDSCHAYVCIYARKKLRKAEENDKIE